MKIIINNNPARKALIYIICAISFSVAGAFALIRSILYTLDNAPMISSIIGFITAEIIAVILFLVHRNIIIKLMRYESKFLLPAISFKFKDIRLEIKDEEKGKLEEMVLDYVSDLLKGKKKKKEKKAEP